MSKSLPDLFDLDRIEKFPLNACENIVWVTEFAAILREAHSNADPYDGIHLLVPPNRALFIAEILEASCQVTMDNFSPTHQESHNEKKESNVHRPGNGTPKPGSGRNHGEGA